MLVYITTYASPKRAIATTSKSTPLMNTPFLLPLSHCGFELNCVDCIVDIVDVDTDRNIVGIDDVFAIDTDEDTITKIRNNESNVLYSYI